MRKYHHLWLYVLQPVLYRMRDLIRGTPFIHIYFFSYFIIICLVTKKMQCKKKLENQVCKKQKKKL